MPQSETCKHICKKRMVCGQYPLDGGVTGEKVRDEHPICWEGWRVSLGNPE